MLDLIFTRNSKEIDYLKFNPCLGKSNHLVLVFSICVEELLQHKKMPTPWDYSRANYDEIRAKWNDIDWAVKFSDKDVNECYKIFLKFLKKLQMYYWMYYHVCWMYYHVYWMYYHVYWMYWWLILLNSYATLLKYHYILSTVMLLSYSLTMMFCQMIQYV